MKIHDKFVIELREVIKGYGNDPTVQDPCKYPCDYKFYEIGGVAICEESFKKMKRLEDEINAVLDKIKAEIGKSKTEHEMQLVENDIKGKLLVSDIYCDIVSILDKYTAESEAPT